jgi:hypothetical protein
LLPYSLTQMLSSQIFCPRLDEHEPLLHMSAVRRLQLHSNTFVFRYAAIRLLDIEIFLDRRCVQPIIYILVFVISRTHTPFPPSGRRKPSLDSSRHCRRLTRPKMRSHLTGFSILRQVWAGNSRRPIDVHREILKR